MSHGRFPSIAAAFAAVIAFTSLASADCVSYGIDFVHGGKYFINTLSADPFTSVSQFEGCHPEGTADILFIGPEGSDKEMYCSSVPISPDNTDMMSTCPILKNEMFSGRWSLLILGNNGPTGTMENPFAYQRDLNLNCGPQQTYTFTPTVTYNITTTPTETFSTTSTLLETETFDPTTTFIIPSKTARRTYTIRPKPVIEWVTRTSTRRKTTWTKSQSISTKTKTASCTIPPRPQQPDPTCTITPKKLAPAALATLAATPRKRADTPVDINAVRRRMQEARKRHQIMRDLEARAADEPTITVTANEPANTTSTIVAPPTTTTETAFTTSTVSITLPPSTVYSGIYTSTITLPIPTRTRGTVTWTTSWTTKTIYATWTRTVTVTPTASVTACRRHGGHFGGGRR